MGAPIQGSSNILCPQSLSLVRVVCAGMMQLCRKTSHLNTRCYPSKLGTFWIWLVPGLKLEFGNWSAQLEKVLPGLCWCSPGSCWGSQKCCTTSLQEPSGYLRLHPSSPGTKPAAPRLNTHIRAEHSALALQANASCCSDTQISPRREDRCCEGRGAASPRSSLG